MRQPGTISHRRHGFHRKNYLAGNAQPEATGKCRTSAASAVQRRSPATRRWPPQARSSTKSSARTRASTSTTPSCPGRGALRLACIPHPAPAARMHHSSPPAPTGTNAPIDPLCSATSYAVGYGAFGGQPTSGRTRRPGTTTMPTRPPRHLEPPRLPWRLTLVALGFSASAAIGDLVDVTGSGHYSATSDLEVTGDDLFPGGTRPAAGCWKMLENGRSQAGRKPFVLVGLPGVEPGTSS
jgi:hypothetical protein